MIIGIGNTIPEIVNLPGQGGEVILLTISYPSSAFCPSASDPTPTVSGNVGAGTFSSTAGLVFVDSGGNTGSSTGEINISASTPGATYTITYTDTNSAVATTPLTLNALDNATFSYLASSFAQDASNPSPIFPSGAITGGTFSAGIGLIFVDSGSNINSSTGEINLSASTIASYTITYDTTSSGSSVCPNTSTFAVAVTAAVPALAQINNVYSMAFDGINDVVRVDETQLTGNSSVSLWFKTSAVTSSSNFDQLLGGGIGVGTTNAGYFQYLSISSNKIVNYGGGAIGYFELASTAVNDGAWHNLILTYDPTTAGGASRGTLKAYLDGTLTSTTDTNGYSINWTSSTLRTIGNYGTTNTNRPFDGTIDEVAAWNVILTQDQVSSIYNATEVVAGVSKTADLSQLTTPPVKWYRMGD